MFGQTATRATLEINKQELRDLVEGKFLPVAMDDENGYVILSIESRILGLGLLIDGSIRTQIPHKEIMYSMRGELEKLT
jgi:NOL1/NOP2/fmu family ribosome biogenesis protein